MGHLKLWYVEISSLRMVNYLPQQVVEAGPLDVLKVNVDKYLITRGTEEKCHRKEFKSTLISHDYI